MAARPMTVLGAGSWGTALALCLARCGFPVRIWSIEPSEIKAMLADKRNQRYLPDILLPKTIHPEANLAAALEDVEDIVIVVPSVGLKQTFSLIKPFIKPSTKLLCAAKGLDENGQLPNQIAAAILGKDSSFAVLSGPTFAREVAAGIPSAVVIASLKESIVAHFRKCFDSPHFRTFPSDDVVGVEIGGIVKNVMAIAVGMSDGVGFGANTRSAIITLSLAEIIHLANALGARTETLIGLSGMGDLILTCSDNQSRNRRFGLALGEGQDISTAEKNIGQVVEGKRNAELVIQLAKRNHVHMPICELVQHVIQGKLSPKEAVLQMLAGHSSYL